MLWSTTRRLADMGVAPPTLLTRHSEVARLSKNRPIAARVAATAGVRRPVGAGKSIATPVHAASHPTRLNAPLSLEDRV
jgi:hypothetical protein